MKTGTTDRFNIVESYRTAKSDTVKAGAKIQAFLDIASPRTFCTTLSGNAFCTAKGIVLVDPVLENTPILPDGVTASTFLEAGEELSFDISGTTYFANCVARKIDNDRVRITCNWNQMPKQGTSLTITYPSSNISIRDGAANAVLVGTGTVEDFNIVGNMVVFNLRNTSAYTSLNTGPLAMMFAGTGGKFTIT